MATKEEARAEVKAASEAGASSRAPLFSATGVLVLVVACAVCALAPTAYFLGRRPPSPPVPDDHPGQPGPPGRPFKRPLISNTVPLEPISMPYRESGIGGPRRSLSVTVVLEVRTETDADDGQAPEGLRRADEERRRAVERLTPWILDRIYGILRGKGPEDFATNELVEQVQQQIKRAINDEKFGKDEVVQNVLFVKQSF